MVCHAIITGHRLHSGDLRQMVSDLGPFRMRVALRPLRTALLLPTTAFTTTAPSSTGTGSRGSTPFSASTSPG